ncbi:hypothetical protein F5X96DRAFT_647065 [Biscogniauxia mediterranea]|nr:hypothetical protein F5X96DRAFT_647065 [Biscogniauxia mediterranea]
MPRSSPCPTLTIVMVTDPNRKHSLRKVVYSGYYLTGSAATIKKPPGFDVNHLDHCVDHLRQSLMCGVDISVMPNPCS